MVLRALLITVLTATLLVLAAAQSSVVMAADTSKPKTEEKTQNISQAIVQSYVSDEPIQIGMIVKINSEDKTRIAMADQKSPDSILGVTIAPNDSPVTITQTEANKSQIFVANSGRYSVLVSNQNGQIKSGDYISISALAGIGMKTDKDQAVIIGTATSSFNGTSNVIGSVKLKDTTGNIKDVSLGRVTVAINIAKNPLNRGVKSDYVPGFLAQAAQTVSDKPISAARIYLAIVILLSAAFVSSVVLFSGVRSGMMAVGRNPLSKKSIVISLVQTVVAGLIIFIVGVFAVYLILKL